MMKNRYKRHKIHGGFVAITNEMINSDAYKLLSGSSLKALVLCMRKVKTNNPIDRFKSHFALTYPEARKSGLCDASFCRGLKLLQQLGFIDFVLPGGMRFQSKASSLYRLSQRWKKYGTPEFEKKAARYYEGVQGDENVF